MLPETVNVWLGSTCYFQPWLLPPASRPRLYFTPREQRCPVANKLVMICFRGLLSFPPPSSRGASIQHQREGWKKLKRPRPTLKKMRERERGFSSSVLTLSWLNYPFQAHSCTCVFELAYFTEFKRLVKHEGFNTCCLCHLHKGICFMNNVNAHMTTTLTYASWNMFWMWIENQPLDITVSILTLRYIVKSCSCHLMSYFYTAKIK